MERPTHILVECPALIPSVRLGVMEPLKPLEKSGRCQVRFLETMKIRKSDIAWSDVLICVRGFEYSSLKVVEAAKKAGRYVLYFLDDDLLNIPKNIPSSDYFSDKDQKRSLINILELSDILWCVNPLIVEKYSKYTRGRWMLSKVPVILSDKPSGLQENESINIIYAGSIDHSGLIREYLTPVIKVLCQEFGESLHFTFIGADPGLEKYKNITHYKYIDDYDKYRHLISDYRYHIGLSPIYTTQFYQSKYYNKFIEYTMMGAVGIYSNSQPYTNIVENGKNGLLCENTYKGWYEAIKSAISSRELRENCISEARNILNIEFAPLVIAERLSNDIPELINFRAREILPRKISLGNMFLSFYLHRMKMLVSQYGIKAIPMIIWKLYKKILKYFQKKGAY